MAKFILVPADEFNGNKNDERCIILPKDIIVHKEKLQNNIDTISNNEKIVKNSVSNFNNTSNDKSVDKCIVADIQSIDVFPNVKVTNVFYDRTFDFLSCIVKNKHILRKLLKFLQLNKIISNQSGEVVFKNNVLSETDFNEVVCDAVDGTRKKLPKNYNEFYKLLKDLNINKECLSKNRYIYI